MKPSSCASRSELVLALVGALGFTGCAAAARPLPAEPAEAPPAAESPSSVVEIEFSNGSAKASVSVDLSQTDVQLDMRTRMRRDTSSSAGARLPPAGQASSLPGATTPAPQVPAAPDSVTRAVVAGIRRGQELFLKGDLAGARESVGATLALRSTAEAHALAGSIDWVSGDAVSAREHWRTSLRLDPDQPGVADILARTAPGPDAPEPGKAPVR